MPKRICPPNIMQTQENTDIYVNFSWLILSSLSLTQTRLSVWTQDGSRSTATVGLGTPGAGALNLITDVVEICPEPTNTSSVR